ncbi:ATP-binding protein [Micromonospora sp. CPCC 206061]|uniref:ATP-binding protein n=1 Tax=Micromonospora sp. CPCC 206061 TaxID=3122410 RepID=UPI002FEF775D
MSELSARFDMPLSEQAPGMARRAVGAVLAAWGFGDEDWLDGARVVVSELISNAVRHGNGCVELRVQAHGDRVIVSAADGSSVVPRRRRADDAGGRGLAVIEAFAPRWGVEDHEGGKRVWVELSACLGWRSRQ